MSGVTGLRRHGHTSSGDGGTITPVLRKGSGTATVASGTTSITVTHGAGYTPSVSDIRVTPTNNPTNAPAWYWISSVGGTTFTLNVRTDPGAGGATFAWSVDK